MRSGFAEFFDTERDSLVRAIRLATGDHDLALDVVDEAMARAYSKWRDVSVLSNRVGWVYRVAMNLATSRFRRLGSVRRRAHLVADIDRHEDDSLSDLAEALMLLPVTQRSVIVMRFYLDWDVSMTAVALGVPAGTVKSRTKRALTALGAELGKEIHEC